MNTLELEYLYINNYRQFKKVAIEFNKLKGLVGVYGLNGSGKSNLFESMNFCLFQEGSLRKSKKGFIRKGKDSAGVAIGVQGEKNYKIDRLTHLSKITEFDIYVDNVEKRIKNVTDFNEFVKDEVKIDYDIWKNTVYYSDEFQNLLLTGTEGQKIKTATSMVKYFSMFDNKLEEVRKSNRKINEKINNKEGVIEQIEDGIKELKGDLVKEKKKLRKLVKKNKEVDKQVDEIEDKIKKVKLKAMHYEKMADDFKKKYDKKNLEVTEIKTEINLLEKEYGKGGVSKECRTCKVYKETKSILDTNIKVLYDKFEFKKSELDILFKNYEDNNDLFDQCEEKLCDVEDLHNELIKSHSRDSEDIVKKSVNSIKKSIVKKKGKLVKENRILKRLNKQYEINEEKEHFFSSKGFREWEIKERFFPIYYEVVSDMLEKYGFDEFGIKRKKNKFDLTKHGRVIDSKELSTGEKKIFSILFNQALCKMYEMFGNISYGFRIFDEPLAKLDGNNLRRILQLIEDISINDNIIVFLLTNMKEVMNEIKHRQSIILDPSKFYTKVNVNY